MHGYVEFVDVQRGVAGLRLKIFARQPEPVELSLTELELVRPKPDAHADRPRN
jgi:hypothetical protein